MIIKFKFNKKEFAYECDVTANDGQYIIHSRELKKIIANQIKYEEQKKSGDMPDYLTPVVGFIPNPKDG